MKTKVPGLRYWSIMLPLTALAIVCEVATFVLSGKPGRLSYWTLLLSNSYCYLMNFLLAGLWLEFMSAHLYRSDKTKRFKSLLNIYLILSVTQVALNMFIPIFFRFNETHIYERVMPGFFIAAVIPATVLIFSLIDYRIFIKRHHKMRFFRVEAFLAPVFLGLGPQMITPATSYISFKFVFVISDFI